MKAYIAVTIAAFVMAGAGYAQGKAVSKTGTTAATFLEISVGAPAVGMGSAFVSIANDATALRWNPAGAAGFQQANVVIAHTNWIADTKFDFAAVAVPLGGFGTLGFSLISLSMGDMKVRTLDFPEGTGEFFSAGDLSGAISYSRKLTERFSLGITAKYVQQTIWHESANGFALDIGTLFQTDLFGGMTIGASLSNFGTSMKMSGRDARQFIRLNPNNLGTTDQIPTDVEFASWDLPLFIQFGVSTHLYNNDTYKWVVAVDALHPNDNYESVNCGTELSYKDFLFLRAGYQSLALDKSEGGLSFGVGVSSNTIMDNLGISFDYAFQDMGRFDNVHVLTLGLRF